MIVKVLVGWSRANVYDFYLTIAGEIVRDRERSHKGMKSLLISIELIFAI